MTTIRATSFCVQSIWALVLLFGPGIAVAEPVATENVNGRVLLEQPLVQFEHIECQGPRIPIASLALAADFLPGGGDELLLARSSSSSADLFTFDSQGCATERIELVLPGSPRWITAVRTTEPQAQPLLLIPTANSSSIEVFTLDLEHRLLATRKLGSFSIADDPIEAIALPQRNLDRSIAVSFRSGRWLVIQATEQSLELSFTESLPGPVDTVESILWSRDLRGGPQLLVVGGEQRAIYRSALRQASLLDLRLMKKLPGIDDLTLLPPVPASSLNSADRLLVWSPEASSVWELRPNDSATAITQVAQLSNGVRWLNPISGAFLGQDHYALLLAAESGSTWWLLTREANRGVELAAVAGPLSKIEQLVLSGDFNGDFRDDLLVDTGSSYQVLLASEQIGAVGVSVRINQSLSLPVSAAGTFSAPKLAQAPLHLQLSDALDRTINPSQVTVDSLTDLPIFYVSPNIRAEATQESAETHIPQVCLGLPQRFSDWGTIGSECAPGFVAIATDDLRSGSKNAQLQEIYRALDCCPLPANDILLPEHRYVDVECPENFVITGGSGGREYSKVRCTRLNSERYFLDSPQPGVYWGEGFNSPRIGQRLPLHAIPPALRYGIGRRSRQLWDTDGCIGKPPGSLLTAYGLGTCENQVFRQLLYQGRPGDPVTGTAVEMFRNCRGVDRVESANPICLE